MIPSVQAAQRSLARVLARAINQVDLSQVALLRRLAEFQAAGSPATLLDLVVWTGEDLKEVKGPVEALAAPGLAQHDFDLEEGPTRYRLTPAGWARIPLEDNPRPHGGPPTPR